MKFLIDENLSRRLLEAIDDLFPGSTHAVHVGLFRAARIGIWDYALKHGFAILTADTDFVTLANMLGAPPKVVLLESCDYPTAVAWQLK